MLRMAAHPRSRSQVKLEESKGPSSHDSRTERSEDCNACCCWLGLLGVLGAREWLLRLWLHTGVQVDPAWTFFSVYSWWIRVGRHKCPYCWYCCCILRWPATMAPEEHCTSVTTTQWPKLRYSWNHTCLNSTFLPKWRSKSWLQRGVVWSFKPGFESGRKWSHSTSRLGKYYWSSALFSRFLKVF